MDGITTASRQRAGYSSAPQDIALEDAASFDVYRQLRFDITSCSLQPNEKLRFDALRKVYSASVGTLREALSHLVSDGLVRIDSGKGFRVAPVSLEDLEDVTAWRIEFECRAIEEAIENGDDNWEANIVSSFHLLSKLTAPVPDAPDEEKAVYRKKHAQFHDALVAECRSPWLLFFRSALQSQALRYQSLAVKHHQAKVLRVVDEHKDIMDAVIGRDVKLSKKLLSDHIQHTADIVKKMLMKEGVFEQLDVQQAQQVKSRGRGRPRKLR